MLLSPGFETRHAVSLDMAFPSGLGYTHAIFASLIGGLGLVLACVGIYGTVSYARVRLEFEWLWARGRAT